MMLSYLVQFATGDSGHHFYSSHCRTGAAPGLCFGMIVSLHLHRYMLRRHRPVFACHGLPPSAWMFNLDVFDLYDVG